MKKRTKITSIILASVLAVNAVGIGTATAIIEKNSGIGTDESVTLSSQEGTDVNYDNFFELTEDEQKEILCDAAKDAVAVPELKEQISTAKKFVSNYFKDVIKIDYDKEIEKIPVKKMSIPDSAVGLVLNDKTVYLNSADVELQSGDEADFLIPYIIHEIIHILADQDELDAEIGIEYINGFDEDVTEYITLQVETHAGWYCQDSSAYHPEYVEKMVDEDSDFIVNYLHHDLTDNEIEMIKNYTQVYAK